MTGASGPIQPAAALSRRDLEGELQGQRESLRERTARLERLTARARELGMDSTGGATRASWRSGDALRKAEKLLVTWDCQLRSAGQMLDGRRGSQGPQDAAGVLLGHTVTLTADRVPMSEQRPPGAASSEPRRSLRQVAEYADEDLRRAESWLRDVADVRRAVGRFRDLLAVPGTGDAVNDSGDDQAGAERLCAQAWADPLGIGTRKIVAAELAFAHQTYKQLALAINRLDAQETYARSLSASGGSAGAVVRLGPAALLEQLRTLESRGDAEGRSDPAGIARLAGLIAAGRSSRGPRVRSCVRSDCSGGVLDEDGMCPICQREPWHREGR
ncbi:hypothetical protein [Streptantibioticus silvisoli]|uniref:Uncharacterized protein n=1 Tax=Streptantibioticus silvisoli TaxID=2705255 RepID=A0ABT6VY44_9ACTN|nr:hypothetical protein [Streptantibioticus silvisoli]MDI5963369.1 hypothetical protein [Streptantibioticus silvisoli]